MKLTFALLLMTTALGADLAAGSAVFAAGRGQPLKPDASQTFQPGPGAALTLIDDDGEESEGGWFWSLSDGDNDDDECEDDESREDCADAASGNAAKSGTVAPPQNGLFTSGTAPVVKSN
jgi:hypothetical protein